MITKLELNNYRRFNKLNVNFNNNVLIIGPNSYGKTSILEALSVASITKSHQTNNLLDLITHNKEFCNIKITDDNKNEYKVVITKKGKTCFYNNKEIKLVSEYIGKLPIIFFSPYNLNLIKGAPSNRRNYINLQISQINSLYMKDLNKYNNLLKERNILLKNDDIDMNLLEAITNQMAEYSKRIIEEREKFINSINKIINSVHSKLNDKEQIEIVYESNLNKNDILGDFNNHLANDIKNKQTEIGIQRDDFIFLINQKDSAKFGSLGQIRSLILSLQITLCYILNKIFKKYPLLLLDDVFGELDTYRINNLLEIINNLGQVIISSVNLNGINKDLINNYQIINLGVD